MEFWLFVMLSVAGGIIVAAISFAVGQHRGYEDGYQDGKDMGAMEASDSFWQEERKLRDW